MVMHCPSKSATPVRFRSPAPILYNLIGDSLIKTTPVVVSFLVKSKSPVHFSPVV